MLEQHREAQWGIYPRRLALSASIPASNAWLEAEVPAGSRGDHGLFVGGNGHRSTAGMETGRFAPAVASNPNARHMFEKARLELGTRNPPYDEYDPRPAIGIGPG